MKKRVSNIVVLLVLSCCTQTLLAQVNPEDIALETDDFQEAYYEALLQKGIENYDKAIVSLEKCLQLQPENEVIYHELGKNYFFQKNYIEAENNYVKATQLQPNNKWYWIDLYEVYYETKNYNQGITTLQKIIPLDKNYKEDLLSLYMYTRQYDKALVLINELDETVGKTYIRDTYRLEINMQSTSNSTGKKNLESAIEQNPLVEENYISLIYTYSENNQEEKARAVAQKMEKNIPNSEWAQVFLFKYHINDNKGTEALASLEKVLNGKKIDMKIKFRMFNEFLIFTTKNSSFETQLNKIIPYFENNPEVNVYTELGKFYYKKKNWSKAIAYLEKAFNTSTNDLETNIFLLASYEEVANYELLLKKASELVDLYPNQPEYYYFAGKASAKVKNFKKAITFLEIGIDYVVDNVALETDFCLLLSETFKEMGNIPKSDQYQKRAINLKKK
ncbi:tetratricopeptide repeat protein [Flavobacterium luminosum]|uniref:Cytochrome C biosynthesis protein n=1 Tax=Flavobacterium luminosum TaxID=2949086 RepID=A0ABT0TQY1_9FLAO|nr:tetratricopeptide repeat protein [Flavobacterium sp. HXWNR70]MCL9809899.1 cytochrome C biosynthesis protein [Flavobacterium sp. HXWNR70]